MDQREAVRALAGARDEPAVDDLQLAEGEIEEPPAGGTPCKKDPPGGGEGTVCTSSAVNWWMRSGNSASQFRSVYSYGHAGNGNASYGNYWQRPAISVAPATIVSDEDADEILLLPEEPERENREGACRCPGADTCEEACGDPEPVTVKIEMKVEYRISVLPLS